MFFEAQMRNTQNEVVIPLEFAIRTDRWKPSFTFVEDITISETLPDLTSNQDNVRLLEDTAAISALIGYCIWGMMRVFS